QLLARYESGEDVFAGDMGETGQESLYPLTDPAVSYPALLYDGPFSDASGQTEYRALAGLPNVDAAGAERALRAFLGAGAVTELRLEGESSIPVDCYEFSVTANGYSMSAGVTKAGAQVLYMLPNEDVTEAALDDQQGVEAARAFLAARGYGEMHESYFSRYDGILTVNFAAVQDDVVLYPDLVKVQVSLRDGAVIGLEAGGYLRNHVTRDLTLPALSQEEAVARLGGRLTAEEARLCVIPENAEEYLCYEIQAFDESGEYLVYIDAQTGAERELFELISEENGMLVM
ncbi:MAG TPA: germination protein YpeB, partial [Candidatus Pullichristensenella stercoripullorum]|nr:germination protein YpeB [Candidatus Pullichristensenella stercoripullorum]